MDNPKAQIQTIRIIHLALMVGPALLILVSTFLTIDGQTNEEPLDILNYVSPGYFLLALLVSPILFKSSIKPAKEAESLTKKMATYQTAHIIRMALLEGSILFSAVVILINGELYHLIVAGLVLAIMFTKIPTPHLLEKEMELSPEERDKLS